MKEYGVVDVRLHVFLTSVLFEVCGLLHASDALPLGNKPPVPIVQEAEWTSEPVWAT
jgi:hypothetical protein